MYGEVGVVSRVFSMAEEPRSMNRAQMLEALAGWGVDTSVINDGVPDVLLAKAYMALRDVMNWAEEQLKEQPDEAAERAKVQAYAERPEMVKALKANGQTSAQLVSKFSELRRKNPTLTAVQYLGVPDGAVVRQQSAVSKAAQFRRVQRFAEAPAFRKVLEAAGKTPAEFAATFARAQKRDPSLTAEAFGVPETSK